MIGVFTNIGILTGIGGPVIGSNIPTLHVTLPDNDTTQIVIGNSLVDESIVILYSATRGSLQGMGEVTILCPFTDFVVLVPAHVSEFDDLGLTFTAELDGTDIVLNCIVDNSSASDIDFNYQV